MTPKMQSRTYVGPVAVIATHIDGRDLVLERGQSVDVSDEAAAALDMQPANWAAPAPEGDDE